jgi:iron complex transport system ATP-binding protein
MSASPLRAIAVSWGFDRAAPCGSGLSLALDPGQLLCVVGPNGAGKSTLLLSFAGQQPLLAGDVELAGQPVGGMNGQQRARRVALLPQSPAIDPDISVSELVAIGRTPHLGTWGRLRAADRETIQSALSACDLALLARRRLGQLSGGERQRALIAMALAQQAPLLLLDEPTAHLDLRRRQELFALLHRVRRASGVAVVMVLHELADAFRESEQVLVLSEGVARICSASSPALRGELAAAFQVEPSAIVLPDASSRSEG